MSNRLVPTTVLVTLLLTACSSSGHSDLSTDQAEAMLEKFITDYSLDTGDTYCDLQRVVDVMNTEDVVATNSVNAAIHDLNESPFDPDALVAVQEAGSELWELEVIRSLLDERIVQLIDDSDAEEAMIFISNMYDDLWLVMGKMLAEATSARDLAVSLSALLESPEALEYLEGQADAISILDDYRNHRCG